MYNGLERDLLELRLTLVFLSKLILTLQVFFFIADDYDSSKKEMDLDILAVARHSRQKYTLISLGTYNIRTQILNSIHCFGIVRVFKGITVCHHLLSFMLFALSCLDI